MNTTTNDAAAKPAAAAEENKESSQPGEQETTELDAAAPAAAAEAGKEPGQPETQKTTELDKFQVVLATRPALRNIVLTLCLCLFPAAVALAWAIWFLWLPNLWAWSFTEFTARSIAGLFAVPTFAALPIYAFVGAFFATAYVLEVYADEAAKKIRLVVNRGSSLQSSAEDELAKHDPSGLVPLLRYSRVQLESYYTIGLTQTQRSFRYSIIAMWIGFSVILGGIVIRVVDLDRFGLRPLDTDISTLIIISGAIIEVISALFLWVYRSSVRQLTYFYNRQLYNHSILMSQRIAETMTSADEIKKTIIEKLLDRSWAYEPDTLPSGQSLLSFRSPKG